MAKGEEYVVTDGTKVVSVHKTKKEAHAAGMARRRSGLTAFAHSKKDFAKHLDPSGKALAAFAAGGDIPRDDQGRFSGK